MFKKALLLGTVTISLVGLGTACVSTSTGGGTGGSGGGLAGTGGTATGGTGGTGTGGTGTGGTGTGGTGTGGTGTGGTATGGTGGTSSVTLPAGCLTDPTQWQVDCNPVTNDGCDSTAGQACDVTNGGWGCYDAPNDAKLGASCDAANGPFCEGTLTCDVPTTDAGAAADAGADAAPPAIGTCKHYCCSDSDCNGGTCTPFSAAQVGTLGVCN